MSNFSADVVIFAKAYRDAQVYAEYNYLHDLQFISDTVFTRDT